MRVKSNFKAGKWASRLTLSEAALYLGDNGRCFCGRLCCAGMTAHSSGRDLSGQKVLALSAASIAEHGFRCETCRAAERTGT